MCVRVHTKSAAWILLSLSIMCGLFGASQNPILAFGMGVSVVNLLVRVGGSIFSKAAMQASQQEDETLLKAEIDRQQKAEHEAEVEEEQKRQEAVAPAQVQKQKSVVVGILSDSKPQVQTKSKEARILEVVGKTIDDVMGVSMDLVDSMVAAVVSAIVVGTSLYGNDGLALPLWLMAGGMLASLLSMSAVLIILRCCGPKGEYEAFASTFVQAHTGASGVTGVIAGGMDLFSLRLTDTTRLLRLMRFGYILTSAVFLIVAASIIYSLSFDPEIYQCVVIGNLSGVLLSLVSEFATNKNEKVLKEDIARQIRRFSVSVLPPPSAKDDDNKEDEGALTKSFRKVSLGLSTVTTAVTSVVPEKVKAMLETSTHGMLTVMLKGVASSMMPVVVVFTVLLWCGNLAGQFGVTIAGVAIMATSAFAISYNSIQPILGGSSALIQMLNEQSTEQSFVEDAISLSHFGDSIGNSVKGFTAGAGSLVAFCMFSGYTRLAGVQSIDLIASPQVLPGLLLGAVLPFMFAALTMSALDAVSTVIAAEKQAVANSESDFIQRMSDSGLASALKHVLVPAACAMGLTQFVGYVFGPMVLAGYLAGMLVSGLVMATTLTNTGAALDLSSSSSFFGSSLKDAGGPAINVLSKFVMVVIMLNSAKSNWAFFGLIMLLCAIIACVFLYNLYKTNTFDFNSKALEDAYVVALVCVCVCVCVCACVSSFDVEHCILF
jgi:Na+/H+-translocating membrane pyrophosphatase